MQLAPKQGRRGPSRYAGASFSFRNCRDRAIDPPLSNCRRRRHTGRQVARPSAVKDGNGVEHRRNASAATIGECAIVARTLTLTIRDDRFTSSETSPIRFKCANTGIPRRLGKGVKSASRQLDRRFDLSWRLQQSLVDRRTPTQSSVWSGFAEPRRQLGTTFIRSGVKFVGAHGLPQIDSLRGRSLLVRDLIARLSDASCAFEIAIA